MGEGWGVKPGLCDTTKNVRSVVEGLGPPLTSSMRTGQYAKNPKACVYFFDQRFFKGVMLKGAMEVLRDNSTKQTIWRDGDEMYYPKGVTDPDYCVLKFTAQSGRFYSDFQSEDFEIK